MPDGTLDEEGTARHILGESATDAEVQVESKRLLDEYHGNQYKRDRMVAYPTIEDQLDDLYHNGVEGWKATIKATKDKHPK